MGNPFASQCVSDPIPVPFDPPHTVTVRKLTGKESDAAQEAHRSNVASASPRSWAATFRRMLEHGVSDPEVLHAIRDPLTGYDRFALVRSGLVAWSYPQSVTPVVKKADDAGARIRAPDLIVSDAIDDLDDEAVDFIATEVLRRTKPGLFQTEPDTKNG